MKGGSRAHNIELKKMKVHVANAEKIWKKALAVFMRDCPQASCE